jgi:hypothetical protein
MIFFQTNWNDNCLLLAKSNVFTNPDTGTYKYCMLRRSTGTGTLSNIYYIISNTSTCTNVTSTGTGNLTGTVLHDHCNRAGLLLVPERINLVYLWGSNDDDELSK